MYIVEGRKYDAPDDECTVMDRLAGNYTGQLFLPSGGPVPANWISNCLMVFNAISPGCRVETSLMLFLVLLLPWLGDVGVQCHDVTLI